MKTVHIDGYQTTLIQISASNTHFVVEAGAAIQANDGGIEEADDTLSGNVIEVDGFIWASNSYSIDSRGTNTRIVIGEHGATGAISLTGTNGTLINNGHIAHATVGVFALNASITNQGVIAGGEAVSGRNLSIVNAADGLISSRDFAGIEAGAEADPIALRLTNHGTIEGGSWAIFVDNGSAIIHNDGTIRGGIVMAGDADDTIDMRGGTVTGVVNAGLGDDSYWISSSKIELREDTDAGFDVLNTSASYVLPANFETLTQIGRADIKATGNTGDNNMFGNSGDNVLSGGDGGDWIAGNRGNDRLLGGDGVDTFAFYSHTGHDVVSDFENGIDHLYLNWITDRESFSDLRHHHVSVSGDDLVIDHGHDTIRLRHMGMSELDASDFLFGAV
jgi:Ca2+-binding RTX toxin-like protein